MLKSNFKMNKTYFLKIKDFKIANKKYGHINQILFL